MANTCEFNTKEGLVIFDVPIRQFAQKTFDQVRSITTKPVKYVIYSHGHSDHAFGYGPFIEEIRKKGWDMPEVVAHENIIKRFKKYEILGKYYDWINFKRKNKGCILFHSNKHVGKWSSSDKNKAKRVTKIC